MALSGLTQFTTPQGTVTAADLERVARIAEVGQRFRALQGLLDGDLHHALHSLAASIRERQSVCLHDLVLAAPGAIAAHMGVDDAEAPDVGAAFIRLEGRIGATEAASRLAGWPTILPPDALLRLGDGVAGRPVEAHGAFGTSPLAWLAELRVRLAADQDGASSDLTALAFAASVEEAGNLFVALVRRGADLALRDPAWATIGDRAFVCLLWAHAEQVTRVLLELGGDPDRLGRWLAAHAVRDAWDRFERTRFAPWARRLTFELTVPALATAAASSVTSGTPDTFRPEAASALQSLCGHLEDGGTFVPALATLSPPPPGPADVWPARDAMPAIVEAGWMTPASPHAVRDDAATARALLSLEAEWREQPASLLILTTLDPDRLGAPLVDEAHRAMQFADASLDLEPDRGGAYHLLNALAAINARRGDPAAMPSLVARHAARCASRWPRDTVRYVQGEEPWERAFGIIAGASLENAIASPGTQAERMAILARNVEAIASSWPTARQACISALDAAARSLDPDAASTIWPTLIGLRTGA